MLQELYKELKENPLEILGGFLLMGSLFGLLYVALWIGCPC